MRRLLRRLVPLTAACALGAAALLLGGPGAAEDEPAAARDPDRESIFELIAPRAGEIIADVGCGKGTWTLPLARAVGAHGRVYAVDIDRNKIDDVRRRMASEGISNVELIHSLPDDPMLQRDSLDAVFVNDVIDHVDRSALAGFLAGIRSALKASGRLIIRDPNGGPGRVIAECYRHGFTLIEARVPLEDMPRRSFTSGWYALKLQRADRMQPSLLPRGGKPNRRLTKLHLAEELFRVELLSREELRTTWETIESAAEPFDPEIDERLDLIRAAEAVGAIDASTAARLRTSVKKP
ncbi:MAG: methyltransferase domain-containing protein [Planctomycetota bacterium]|nr:methyltransferase domain-containing protein [Planctomycetota bacterium]